MRENSKKLQVRSRALLAIYPASHRIHGIFGGERQLHFCLSGCRFYVVCCVLGSTAWSPAVIFFVPAPGGRKPLTPPGAYAPSFTTDGSGSPPVPVRETLTSDCCGFQKRAGTIFWKRAFREESSCGENEWECLELGYGL